ncbi:LysR family transcriptional regulator [Pseudomonas agarici]|uniref:LysR family transcriptional regulator n=1 Tax=Pseudomonas agarici TaxID=46677 RepID=A0A0X1T5Y9_PSEAA|nr:LysR family transcriptional regulator [Pseudomonas agarici]AMB87491.1 LysR family transcriptional regulator [Pseudomonas agarici]
MDLRRLELLMQVAHFDSFSKAATVLGIAQPALGRQMHKLEEECGFRLFYRHGRGVMLTPEGQSLLDRAGPLLLELTAIPSDLQSEYASPKGAVTVGVTPTICNLLGLKLITSIQEKYPELQINLVSGYSGYVHEWLVDGRVDIAILHDARRSASIQVAPLCQAELYFVTCASHDPFKNTDQVELSQVTEHPLVLPTGNHGLCRTLDYATSKLDIKPNIKFQSDTLELLKEIVTANLASTILAKPAVMQEIARGTLSAHLITSPCLFTKLVLATVVNRPVTRAIKLIEQEIKNIVDTLVENDSATLGIRSLRTL